MVFGSVSQHGRREGNCTALPARFSKKRRRSFYPTPLKPKTEGTLTRLTKCNRVLRGAAALISCLLRNCRNFRPKAWGAAQVERMGIASALLLPCVGSDFHLPDVAALVLPLRLSCSIERIRGWRIGLRGGSPFRPKGLRLRGNRAIELSPCVHHMRVRARFGWRSNPISSRRRASSGT